MSAGGNITLQVDIQNLNITTDKLQIINQGGGVAEVTEVSKILGVTPGATRRFFRTLEKRQVAPENVSGKLVEIAEAHVEVLQDISYLKSVEAMVTYPYNPQKDNPQKDAIVDTAYAAADSGDYSVINRYLNTLQARTSDLTHVLTAPFALAIQGDLALAELDYERAANYFKKVSYVSGGMEVRTVSHLLLNSPYFAELDSILNARLIENERKAAHANYHLGMENGDAKTLLASISGLQLFLGGENPQIISHDQAIDWNYLGNAYLRLSEREPDKKSDAAKAYKMALYGFMMHGDEASAKAIQEILNKI